MEWFHAPNEKLLPAQPPPDAEGADAEGADVDGDVAEDAVDDAEEVADQPDQQNNKKKKSRKRKSAIQTAGNFTSLLNIPRAMKIFGPLRQFWDGGARGEKGIQPFKNVLSTLPRHGNFVGNAMNTVHKRRSLREIISRLEHQSGKIRCNPNLCKYTSLAVLKEKMAAHRILHGTLERSGKITLQCKDCRKVHSFRVNVQLLRRTKTLGEGRYDVFNVQISEEPKPAPEKENIESYVLFLPYIPEDESNTNNYIIINSNWETLTYEANTCLFSPLTI